MNPKPAIKIASTGQYVPEIVSSDTIENQHGLPKGWALKNSGVQQRHQATVETIGYMGARALENAIDNSDYSLQDIDLLIAAGASFDYPLPNQASVIKSELKEGRLYDFPTLDIDGSCLSFISAFEIAASLLNGHKYKTIAIVNSEMSSKGLNPNNWETLTLFGDGAAATLLTYDESSSSVYLKGTEKNYTEGVYDSMMKGGGNAYFYSDYPYDPELHSFSMNGKKLLRMVMKKLPPFVKEFYSDIPFSIKETDCIITHQASKAGIALFQRIYGLKKENCPSNLSTHGNCISASIPLVLHQAISSGQLKRGDTCFCLGTAAGFSIGGILFKY